jgi:hypothetical protein
MKKSMVFLTLGPVNKPVKFELKAKHTYFLLLFFYIYKKVCIIYQIRISQQKSTNEIYSGIVKKKKCKGPKNKFKRVYEFFWNFLIF